MTDPSDVPAEVWSTASRLPDDPTPADLDALRRTLPEVTTEHWRTAVTQTLLRRRARTRLGPIADRLWLTRTGLEQASHPAVAQRRADRLALERRTHLTDLGCGLGIDSLAAQRAGLSVTAVEADPQTASYAGRNLGIPVRTGDLRDEILRPDTVAFVDPGRRRGHDIRGTSRRTFDPDRWEPPWPWVAELIERHPATVVKAAPGLPHDRIAPQWAAEWVSVAGSLVETTVWGPDVREGMSDRTATLLTPEADPWAATTHTLTGGRSTQAAPAGPMGDWLLEPDPALIRAGLIAELCRQVDGHLVSPGIAYVTSPHRPPTGWGRLSRIDEVLPARGKHLRAALGDVGHVEIRTRGLGLDPAALRRELRLSGDGPGAQVVVTRLHGKAAALLVHDVT